jgi:hypothetical protein
MTKYERGRNEINNRSSAIRECTSKMNNVGEFTRNNSNLKKMQVILCLCTMHAPIR